MWLKYTCPRWVGLVSWVGRHSHSDYNESVSLNWTGTGQLELSLATRGPMGKILKNGRFLVGGWCRHYSFKFSWGTFLNWDLAQKAGSNFKSRCQRTCIIQFFSWYVDFEFRMTPPPHFFLKNHLSTYQQEKSRCFQWPSTLSKRA